MKLKIALIIASIVLVAGQEVVLAQSDFDTYRKNAQAKFQQYKSDKDREFKEYRDRVNAEFAEYMRQRWPEYNSEPAETIPLLPEPPAPVVKDPDKEPSNDPMPFDVVTPAPVPVTPPMPVIPLPDPEILPVVPAEDMFTFTFYGQQCSVPLDRKHRFTLDGTNENDVADGWQKLSSDIYLPVIARCLNYRDQLQLCDWGYVRFVEDMTNAFFSQSQSNEARLMQMYILTQSGYKVRIARTGSKLVTLLPSKDNIYCYPYLKIDDARYYICDLSLTGNSFYVFNREFPKEQFFSLRIAHEPLLPLRDSASRHLRSEHDDALAVKLSVNKNLIDFYNDYPLTDQWDVYSNASLSGYAKEQLYPFLKRGIAGKSKKEAANMLLHFVQTAFDYATDDQQFGDERPLFGDETLYYPYSDCEDRAILYSILVRELLGLDVVLLHYPGHLATAVCFDSNDIAGDYFTIDGRRYIVCDPTYIHADIGDAMPQYKEIAAEIVKIK